jgi:RNA polymerase sigma-70 factor (ECF subfamily)
VVDSAQTDAEETEAMLKEARAGNPAALDELFSKHRAYLHGILELRMDPNLRSRLDVSDVIQEAHLEALRRIDDYLDRRPMPFRLWLHKTAYECLLRMRRQHVEAKKRAVSRAMPLPERSSILLAGAAVGSTPSQQLMQEELAQRVREAIGRMDEDDREVLLMRNYEGLSNHEVAQVLEIEPDAASKRYGRALLRLRKLLLAGGLSESQA